MDEREPARGRKKTVRLLTTWLAWDSAVIVAGSDTGVMEEDSARSEVSAHYTFFVEVLTLDDIRASMIGTWSPCIIPYVRVYTRPIYPRPKSW